MIEAVVTWFITSKVGRTIALIAAGAAAIGIALLKAFNNGKQAERSKTDRASLDNLHERQETDAEIDGLGHADVDCRLDRWVRKP